MKRLAIVLLLPLGLCVACKNQTEVTSENSVDAARNFIRAALDGNFEKAKTFMLADSANLNWLDVAQRSYEKADQSVKDGYRAASINVVRLVEAVKDSVTILVYSNSYFKDNHDTLKILKSNNQWLVDLKYLFNHDADTLYLKDIIQTKIK